MTDQKVLANIGALTDTGKRALAFAVELSYLSNEIAAFLMPYDSEQSEKACKPIGTAIDALLECVGATLVDLPTPSSRQ